MKKITLLLLFYALLISSVNASISGVSDLTISGSSFGTKTTVAPTFFDNFEGGSFDSWSFYGSTNTSWELTTSGNRVGSIYAAQRNNTAALNWMGHAQGSSEYFYTSFWFKNEASISGSLNYKLWRMWQQDAHGAGNTNVVWNINSNSLTNSQLTVEYASPDNSADVDYSNVEDISDYSEWSQIEIIVATPINGSSDNYVKLYKDGVLMLELTNSLWTEAWDSYGVNLSTLGTYFLNGTGEFLYDDYYNDSTLARVVIGNSNTLDGSTIKEIQPYLTYWSDTEVGVSAWRQGSFNDLERVYLFVVDSAGTASDGYQGYFVDNTFYPSGTGPVASASSISGAYSITGAASIT